VSGYDDNGICLICYGGPGNDCACSCGMQAWNYGKPTNDEPTQERDTMAHSLMQFFTYKHLPERLARVSVLCCDLARCLDAELPDGAEKTVALRKLLESKDAAVRSVVFVADDRG